MSYTGSMAATFRARHDRATDDALKAAAQVVVNGLKEQKPQGLRGGYTSGAFVTGATLGSIFITEVFQGPSGEKFILIATDSMIAVYWEYGHVNLFTRKYEREERWRPTLERKYDDAMAAYARVYQRSMGA